MKERITKVLLADDHPLFRDGLAMALAQVEDLQVVAQVDNGRKALDAIRRDKPDIALLDFDMPDLNALEVAKAVRSEALACRLIFVTMHKHAVLVRQSIAAGISGYLLKDSASAEIVMAARTVAKGESYFSAPIASILVDQSRKREDFKAQAPGIDSLTPAERRIIALVASDRTSKEIAGDLGVSVRTVEAHRAKISGKLGLSGAHSLVKFAFAHRAELEE